MTKPLPLLRLLAISAFGFALTMLSNTLEPAVLGHKVLELAPNQPNTALGFTTFAGLIVAILVQPIVGVLSDRARTRWGRRMPFFVVGTLLVMACLLLIALAPDFALLVAGVLMIQFASNTVQGPWQALIPDHVAEKQRGQASSIKAIYDILALIAGRAIAGQLVGRFSQWGQIAILAAVGVPSLVFVAALIITGFSAREGEDTANAAPQMTIRQALSSSFRIDLRAHPAFGWWFANRLLFWAAFIALNTFLLFYAIDVIKLQQDEAQRYIGTLSTVLGAALVIISIPSGWITDRIGRKPLIVAAGLIAMLGTLIILIARDLGLVTVAAGVIGIGIGMFLSANWALITDIVPRNEAARYLGVANIATAGGSAIARFIGGAIIDPLNHLLGSSTAGYMALYAIAALFFLLSALVILPLPTKPAGVAADAGNR
ncbi:MAG: MFS transporter [Chloroflexi bacterium]|nr:MFS transporter [Chloroflexota bacterium]MCL5275200.1 MFS transporter [Chloroflexota bacterium]